MTTKAQAVKALHKLGFEFAEDVTGKFGYTWMATIDTIGRTSLADDCHGLVVFDYTATASEFWAQCVREAESHARYIGPCPHTPGECEFHDWEEE